MTVAIVAIDGRCCLPLNRLAGPAAARVGRLGRCACVGHRYVSGRENVTTY